MTGAVAVLIEFAHCLASLILLRAVQLRVGLPCTIVVLFFCNRPRRAGIRRLTGREEKQSSAN